MAEKYNRIQKCMFGVKLKESADTWSKANPDTNKDAYADVVGMSRSGLYKAYKGDVSEVKMEFVAERLDIPIEEMIKLKPRLLLIHIQTRLQEEPKLGKEAVSIFMMLYCMVLFILNRSLLNMNLLLIFGSDCLLNSTNLWRIKLEALVKEEKKLKILKVTRIVLIIMTLILGVRNQL